MNCFIGHTVTKQERDAKPGRNLYVSNGSVNQKNRQDTADENPLRSTSLPSEILESAHFFFQQKGFEKTAIEDIYNRLISTALNSTTILNHRMKCSISCGRGERMMYGF